MFAFLHKINPKKDSKSGSLKQKDSVGCLTSSFDVTLPQQNSSNDLGSLTSTKSARKSNLSLTSIGSGYFTTGRFYEHKKKGSPSLGILDI